MRKILFALTVFACMGMNAAFAGDLAGMPMKTQNGCSDAMRHMSWQPRIVHKTGEHTMHCLPRSDGKHPDKGQSPG